MSGMTGARFASLISCMESPKLLILDSPASELRQNMKTKLFTIIAITLFSASLEAAEHAIYNSLESGITYGGGAITRGTARGYVVMDFDTQRITAITGT